jgi:hypothetical protein
MYSNGQFWNKTYLADRPVMLFSSIVHDDTCYKVIGVTAGHTDNFAKALLGNIDLSGELTNYKLIGDSILADYSLFKNSLIKTSDGRFAFTGYSYQQEAYLFFGIASPRFDSISVFRYTMPNTFAYFGNALIQKDGYYYITGLRTDSAQNDVNVCLIKIDSLGNKVFERKWGQIDRYEEAHSLTALANGNILIGAERVQVDLAPETSHTWLIEVNTSGGIVRQWLDPNDSTYGAFGLQQTSDGGFIYGAQKKFEQTVNSVNYTATIVKLDNAFNKQWTFSGGYPGAETGFFDICQNENSEIIACGKSNYRFAWVVKLTAAGFPIWDKEYAVNTASGESHLKDIDTMEDGSLIAVGQYLDLGGSPPQVGWFLKLNSEGCEIENCAVGIDELKPVTSVGKINLYPNPAQRSITFDYENIPENSRLMVTDLVGQVITTLPLASAYGTLTLNTGNYPNGVYLLSAEADGKVLLKQKFIVLK